MALCPNTNDDLKSPEFS